jgi:diguanylate cyclase (GGDEF)-like protein
VDREAEVDFWVEHARAGAVLTLGLTFVNLLYAIATWDSGPNRDVLVAMNAVAILSAMTGFRLAPEQRIARSPYRDWIFGGWCLVPSVLVAVAAYLDGGINSPYAWLFPVSVMLTAAGHRPLMVALTTTSSIVGVIVVSAADDAPNGSAAFVRIAYLVALGYLSTIAARTRWGQFEEQLEKNASLARLAERDGLTGLLNHRAFHLRLAAEIDHAQRVGGTLSLLLIDLDHFKEVNDQFGHLAGDEVLRQVAAVLQDVAREGDVVARVGGEEFCVLLPNTAAIGARLPAERVRAAVAVLRDPVPLTVSVGVASYPEDATAAPRLFEKADEALYEAKRRGRNRVHTTHASVAV